MSEPLRLNAHDKQVWRRTLDALNTDPNIAAKSVHLEVRCAKCHCHLGDAWSTPLGPLFTSSWEVERPTGIEVEVNGKRLGRRAAIRWEAAQPWESSGPPMTYIDRHGTIALLALPPEMVQDYPALMVRCQDDGDAVLNRTVIIDALRDRPPTLYIETSFPRLSYDISTPDISHPAINKAQAKRTRRYGASS